MPNKMLEQLKTRRSTATVFLAAPGPTPEQLKEILTIGLRVPDHGGLEPWRLIIVQGEERQILGKRLTEYLYSEEDTLSEQQRKKLSDVIIHFVTDVPLTIYVVSCINKESNVPENEQTLSCGAVCMNLLWAANAYGYGANWISGLLAHSEKAKQAIGIKADEQIAGVIFVGTSNQRLPDRKRPNLEEKVSYWPLNR